MQAWTISNGLGNPASLYPNELRVLFDTAFRGDYAVRKTILGFDHDFLRVRKQHAASPPASLYARAALATNTNV